MGRRLLGLGGMLAVAVAGWLAATAGAPSPPARLVSAGSMHARRFDQSATLLSNGTVLIAGGMERNGVYLASTETFDPASLRFTPTAPMPSPRSCQTAVLLDTGRVLLAGGSGPASTRLASAELYDPASSTFTPTGNLVTARCGAASAVLPDHRVLLVGGIGPASDHDRLSSAEIYDPASGRFSPTGSMRVPRSAHAAVLLKNGKVLVMGGSSSWRFPNEVIESSAELYDPKTGQFSPTGSMTIPRYKIGAVALNDGRALVVGGSDNRAWRGKYSSAEIYDPATGRFTRTADMAYKRYKLPMGVVLLPGGQVLVAGGAERPELFDPRLGEFKVVGGTRMDGWCFSTATSLSNGDVLVAGGYGDDPGRGGFATAYLYRP
jgi:hypothetical protein